MENPNHKGNVAELAIATEAARLGLSVLKPLTEHERYDLVISIKGPPVARPMQVGCASGKRRHRAPQLLLPVALFAGRGVVNLRLRPTGSNQRAAVNWATDYELRGAIAQLEERLTGSQEVVGSSPTSSIPSLAAEIQASFPGRDGFEDLSSTVGMDEFYAKLAQYVRRAEAGDETLVTRWGKPVARLGPARLKESESPADE